MCDYSLHAIKSRPAVVGDKLSVSNFIGTYSKGLASPSEPETAVCVLPGTEVAFDNPVTVRRHADGVESTHSTGIFRQVSETYHRDGFEFPNGETCSIQGLLAGTGLTVLQLPAPAIEAKAEASAAEPSPAEETEPELESAN